MVLGSQVTYAPCPIELLSFAHKTKSRAGKAPGSPINQTFTAVLRGFHCKTCECRTRVVFASPGEDAIPYAGDYSPVSRTD
jgi:hypothetical protein